MKSPFVDNETGAGFSPAVLFALNEPGVWYDPSDVANLDWRRNLLTWTEQFDNAAWTKTGLTVSGNQISYAGGSGLTRECVQLVTIPGGTANKVLTAYVTVSGSGKFRLKNTHSAVQDNFSANITATGTRQTVTLTVTNSASAGNGLQAISIITSTDDAAFSLTVHEFQLELGSTATEYQRITDVNTEVIQRFPSATLYQDTAGTTPVTTPGQSVALALDKSKGLVLGSELVTSPYTGSVSASWAVTSTNVTRNGSSTGQAVLSLSTAIDTAKRYYVTFTVADLSGDTMLIRIGGSGTAYQVSANGVYTARLIGGGTGSSITFAPWAGSAGQATITNISVKELPGFHATQATAGSRPIYGIVPVGGRRNLLTWTEDFSNAAWVRSSAGVGALPTRTLAAGTSPAGVTACRLAFSLGGGTATTDLSTFYQQVTLPSGAGVFSVWLRSFDGTSSYVMQLVDPTGAAQNITVTGSWQRFQVTATSGGSAINYALRLRGGQTPANSNTADVLFSQPQVETGSTATAYQRVVSQYDVTEAGVSSLSYLAFDGVDDFLVTPTITPGIDKAQVFAGVRKLSDAAIGTVVESSTNAGANDGAFAMFAPISTGASGNYQIQSRFSTAIGSRAASHAQLAPDTSVLTGVVDGSGDYIALRTNGTLRQATTLDFGTGNYLAYPLYIGRRGGTTLPFNGNLFSLIVRFGANLTADQITSTETWVNGKTRAY
jgi:hypothetical protein